jgi:hypothetical protein
MLKRTVSIALVLALIATSSLAAGAEEFQQTAPAMRKVVQKAVEKNRQITVFLKVNRGNNKKFSGLPSSITDEGLTLTEKNSGQQLQFDFADLREVQMNGSHTGLYVGLGAAAGAGIAVLAVLFHELGKD